MERKRVKNKMLGMDKMLKPMLGFLEIAVPDAEPECDEAKFMVELVQIYCPEDLPKDLIRRFMVDGVNKNPDKFEATLRDLNMRMLHFFNRKKE